MTVVDEREAQRPGRVRRILVPVLGVAIVAALGAWGWQSFFPDVEAHGPGYGIGSAPTRAAMTVGLSACLDGGGSARIVDVRPTGTTNGLRVRAFGVNNGSAGQLGSTDEPVSALPAFDAREITRRCGGEGSNLAVQVDAPTYPASARGFEIVYQVRGLTRSVQTGTSVRLYRGPSPGV